MTGPHVRTRGPRPPHPRRAAPALRLLAAAAAVLACQATPAQTE
jgi:hypothetical protein